MIQRIIIGVICLLGSLAFSVAAETPVTLFPEPESENTVPLPDRKDKGHRTPPRPISCIIDTDARTITSASDKVNNADTFEIWDADGQACLQVFGSKEDSLDALAASSGQAVVIKLRGDGYTLAGYLVL